MNDCTPTDAGSGNITSTARQSQEAYRRLVTAFYARVAVDPIIRPLYGKSFRCPMDSLTSYLAYLLGEPADLSNTRFHVSPRRDHARFQIGIRERDAWLKNMNAAIDETIPNEAERAALRALFKRASLHLVNRGERVDTPLASAPNTERERLLERRWRLQLALEEIFVATRRGDADAAIGIVETPFVNDCLIEDRRARLAVLSMLGCAFGDGPSDYVRRTLCEQPEFARERYSFGRTLLHDAAGAWNAKFATTLLEFGADPNAFDAGGHPPLYHAANSNAPRFSAPDGAAVVRLLVQNGADVNARSGVQRCSALHMAARRGSTLLAEALLDLGADIEARDRAGDTPLRRAVNCDEVEIAALLLTRSADPHAAGSRNLTPVAAARSQSMMRLLRAE